MNITNLIPPFSAFVATVWIVGIVPLKVLEPPLFLLANCPQFLLLSLLLPVLLPLLFPVFDVPVLLAGSLVLLGIFAAVDVDVLGVVVLILIDPDFLHVLLVSPADLFLLLSRLLLLFSLPSLWYLPCLQICLDS